MNERINWQEVWKQFDAWAHKTWPMTMMGCALKSCVCQKVEELVCEQLGIRRFTESECKFCRAMDTLCLTGAEYEELITKKGQALHVRWIQQKD